MRTARPAPSSRGSSPSCICSGLATASTTPVFSSNTAGAAAYPLLPVSTEAALPPFAEATTSVASAGTGPPTTVPLG